MQQQQAVVKWRKQQAVARRMKRASNSEVEEARRVKQGV